MAGAAGCSALRDRVLGASRQRAGRGAEGACVLLRQCGRRWRGKVLMLRGKVPCAVAARWLAVQDRSTLRRQRGARCGVSAKHGAASKHVAASARSTLRRQPQHSAVKHPQRSDSDGEAQDDPVRNMGREGNQKGAATIVQHQEPRRFDERDFVRGRFGRPDPRMDDG